MKRMTYKEIQDKIFIYDEGYNIIEYNCEAVRELYKNGVDYKKLSMAKWKYVKKAKLAGIIVTKLDYYCGYCYKYEGRCGICPLGSKYGQVCGLNVHFASDGISLKYINYILKCVREGWIYEKNDI